MALASGPLAVGGVMINLAALALVASTVAGVIPARLTDRKAADAVEAVA